MTPITAPSQSSELVFPFDQISGSWWVLHTQPRQEKVVGEWLQSIHQPCFMPLCLVTRYYGRRKMTKELPVFPSYVFFKGEKETLYPLDRLKRLVTIIEPHDEPSFVKELVQIKKVLDEGENVEPLPSLAVGVNVRVRSGPFKGFEGVIESWSKNNRLFISVQMMERSLAVEIEGSLLDAV